MVTSRWSGGLSTLIAFAGVAVLAFWAGQAEASILIDDFASTNWAGWPLHATGAGSVTADELGLASVIGGRRETSLSLPGVPDIPGLDEATAEVFSGGGFSLADYASTTGATGLLEFLYRGSAFGNANWDLSGETGIQVDFLAYDAPAGQSLKVQATLQDLDSGTLGTTTAYLTTGGPQTVLLTFAGLSGPVNLASVDVITIGFSDAKAADFRVDKVSAYVPEPATLALLGLGVAGFLARRRHRGDGQGMREGD